MKKILFLILFLFLITAIYGANEIRSFQESGNTLYAVIREIDGDVWHIVDQKFDVWGKDANDANDYDISLTDKSGGFYVGDFNTAVTAGYYFIITHQQEGGSPDDADPPIWQEYGYWDGTNWTASNFADIPTKEEIRDEIDSNSTQLAGIIEDTGTTIPNLIADVNTNIIADINDITVDNNAIAAAVWDYICEGTYSYKDYMRELASLVFGKMNRPDSSTANFYSPADITKLRLTETGSSSGRTPTLIDPSD